MNKIQETIIAMILICGVVYILTLLAADAPASGYRPSREEILHQCEQVKDDALLDKCFEAARKARK